MKLIVLIKKRLPYKSITVLSLYVALPIIVGCKTISSFDDSLTLDHIHFSLLNNTKVMSANFL